MKDLQITKMAMNRILKLVAPDLNGLNKPILKIRNETFKFGMPETAGLASQWYHSYEGNIRHRMAFTKKKKSYPKLSLINKTHALICCDFDTLPIGFSSFSEFNDHLSTDYPEAIVVHSVSGKSKMFWIVKHDSKISNMLGIQIRFVAQALLGNSKLWPYVDTASASFTQCYVNVEMIDSIKRQINNKNNPKPIINYGDIKVFGKKRRESISIVSHLENNKYVSSPILRYGFQLPGFLTKQFIKGSDQREDFIRILIYNTNALLTGYGISTKFLAN